MCISFGCSPNKHRLSVLETSFGPKVRVEWLSVCANPIIIWSSAQCILGYTSNHHKQGGPWIIYSIERFTTDRASQPSFIFTVWFTCHFLLEWNGKSVCSAFAFIFTLPQSWNTDKFRIPSSPCFIDQNHIFYCSEGCFREKYQWKKNLRGTITAGCHVIAVTKLV